MSDEILIREKRSRGIQSKKQAYSKVLWQDRAWLVQSTERRLQGWRGGSGGQDRTGEHPALPLRKVTLVSEWRTDCWWLRGKVVGWLWREMLPAWSRMG